MVPPIVVVDDDSSVCEAMISLLKANEFKVKSFCTAMEFLNSSQLEETGCLILDLHMPGFSGLELQRHLLEENRRIPIICISAEGTAEAREEVIRAGAIAFLSKPFSEKALLNSIHLALENLTNMDSPKYIRKT
jgi:FixJ family two-component response regulator